MIHSFKGVSPTIHPSVYLVQSAEIIGDVVLEKDCSVWYNAVIRGDVNYIRIGEGTNVQDGSILHVRHQQYPLIIGCNNTIGHGAILHACTIKDYCLIGMGAIILDNATIGSYSLIAAGSVVRNDQVVPSGVLVAGFPAKVVRELSNEERTMLETSAQNYKNYVQQYRES